MMKNINKYFLLIFLVLLTINQSIFSMSRENYISIRNRVLENYKELRNFTNPNNETLHIFRIHKKNSFQAFSPDGKYAASISWYYSTVALWSTETGQCIRTFNMDWVKSIAFSPDGKYIATSSDFRTIIWPTETGQDKHLMWSTEHKQYLRVFEDHKNIEKMAFSPDGKFIASRSAGERNIKLWSTEDGKVIKTFEGFSYPVSSIVFSPSGKYIASSEGFFKGSIKLWNIKAEQCLHTFKGHTCVKFSPDEKHIAYGADDKTIKLCSIKTGQCIRSFQGHTNSIKSISFSPQGEYIVSSVDKTIKLWSIETGKCERTFKGNLRTDIGLVTFGPQGRSIVSTAYKTLKVWDISFLNNTEQDFQKETNNINIDEDISYRSLKREKPNFKRETRAAKKRRIAMEQNNSHLRSSLNDNKDTRSKYPELKKDKLSKRKKLFI